MRSHWTKTATSDYYEKLIETEKSVKELINLFTNEKEVRNEAEADLDSCVKSACQVEEMVSRLKVKFVDNVKVIKLIKSLRRSTQLLESGMEREIAFFKKEKCI